ncbi:MAG: recombinase A [Deltaproteobacteria bacterium]|nr:recombinase A [Deltaproteobacteria bacterium]
MGLSAQELLAVLPPGVVTRGGLIKTTGGVWDRAETAGRLVELSGVAALTMAFRLIRDSQKAGDPAAWVGTASSIFFAPDAVAGGIDLNSLAVVRLRNSRDIPRAAERLLQSGAFGVVVIDLPKEADVPMPLQSRLVGLAQTHDTAVVFVTARPRPLGSLVSLRAETRRIAAGRRRYRCELEAVKDKRRGPGWVRETDCRGPAGL